jgi:hypothetical protein
VFLIVSENFVHQESEWRGCNGEAPTSATVAAAQLQGAAEPTIGDTEMTIAKYHLYNVLLTRS